MLFPRFARSIVLLLGALALLTPAHAGKAKVGDALPDLATFKLEGAVPDLKGKVVLLDFWASWCGPCKLSFPVMRELQDKFGSRGLVIVAVSVDEKKSDMTSFLKKTPANFTVVRDAKGALPEAMGAEKMPTSFVVGADGKIVAVHDGFDGEPNRKLYLQQIEAALKAAGL